MKRTADDGNLHSYSPVRLLPLSFPGAKRFNYSKIDKKRTLNTLKKIINKKKQGHFSVLIDRANHVEYFSSLGKAPTVELGELELKETNKFKQILGRNYQYNKTMLQNQRDYNINTCGLFSIARCLLKEKKLRDYVKIMKTLPRSSDDVIGLMSLLLVRFVQERGD